MIPGTVAVAQGDHVVRGQLLGRVGNSGNSSAPHLHLHVIDRDAIFGANGLPYVFSSFDITGRVASTEAFDRAEATGDPARLGRVRTGIRHNQLPLDQVIVTWPG
jgi:murein DD-endopeptidase MepM/ murein hydrolase activator NlpD